MPGEQETARTTATGGTAKAYLKTEQGDKISCLFNPAELTVTKATSWEPTKGKGKNTGRLRFQQGQPGTMNLTLTLDTTDSGEPVTKHTSALLKLTQVDPALKGASKKNNSARPPWCEFHWGDFHSFKAVVENLQMKFTFFAQNGTPLRAQVTLAMKQYEDEKDFGYQNPTSGTPYPHSVHLVLPGESLDRIASVAYGEPGKWRLIAETNGIVDPLLLSPGLALVLPDPEGVSRA